MAGSRDRALELLATTGRRSGLTRPRSGAVAGYACRRRSGFTLVEILLVVVILAVIAAMFIPNYFEFEQSRRLPESADRLSMLVALCRAEAMNSGRRHRMRFDLDGQVLIGRQVDPVTAPHQYESPSDGWDESPYLLQDVWVEAVQPLPDGPAPILVDNDEIELTELEGEPVSLAEMDQPVDLYFEPDGSSGSIRWVMRALDGRAVGLMLDGRLGRVTQEERDSVPAEDVVRPEASRTTVEQASETEKPR